MDEESYFLIHTDFIQVLKFQPGNYYSTNSLLARGVIVGWNFFVHLKKNLSHLNTYYIGIYDYTTLLNVADLIERGKSTILLQLVWLLMKNIICFQSRNLMKLDIIIFCKFIEETRESMLVFYNYIKVVIAKSM